MEVIIDPKLKQYIELHEKALKKRDAAAMYQLGRLYAQSKKPDSAKRAFELYKGAAAKGFAAAQFMMGLCCETGAGTKRNYLRAIEWYKRTDSSVSSNVMDHPGPIEEAENEIIRMYFDSPRFAAYMDHFLDSVKKDAPEDIMAAAESGDAKAQDRLGGLYHYGTDGVKQDDKLAEYWYRRSAAQGYENGIYHLGVFFEKAKRYKEAAEWYREYAKLRLQWCKKHIGW